jgi:atypical dual specificity phosphatase
VAKFVKKMLDRLFSEHGFGSWITPSLVACSYPDSEEEIAALASQGVSLLVNLHTRAHPAGALAAHGLTELHLPTRDFTAPKMESIATAVAAVDREIAAGRRVAIHCGAGLGRTGTLAACYLVHTGMKAEAAIKAVRRARPGSIETAGQEDRVREYERSIR